MKKISFLNFVYISELLLFLLIVTGIAPRFIVPYITVVFILYVLSAKIEDSLIFFIRSIPFFVAIPLGESFDSFNMWRILSLIIFLRTVFEYRKNLWEEFASVLKSRLRFFERHKFAFGALILLIISILSVFVATDKVEAAKRIIYFVNLSFVPVVMFYLSHKNIELAKRFIKNLIAPVVIVVLVGLFQLAMTYFVDIYQFMYYWGEGVQCRQFGEDWCQIAVYQGNTWLAYYGPQLSLRVFSLFPDTHSMPIYLLLGIPALFTIALGNAKTSKFMGLLKHKSNYGLTLIALAYFVMILTGTRGIWIASVPALIFGTIIYFVSRRSKVAEEKRSMLLYIISSFAIFFVLFIASYAAFVSPQFLVSKGNYDLFGSRLKSVVDFGETSNAARIKIWKNSILSIQENPILGVGIGNFPTVLKENIALSKAGSSAHNLYLHIASELGIFALVLSLWLLFYILSRTYNIFVNSRDQMIYIYVGAFLVSMAWILTYVMTDVAITDERAFLMFGASLAIIFSADSYESKTKSNG